MKLKFNTIYAFKWEYCDDAFFNVFYHQDNERIYGECVGSANNDSTNLDPDLSFRLQNLDEDLDNYTELGPYNPDIPIETQYPELFL